MFACTHTGVLGIKVKIMLAHDPTGKSGPKKPLPDQVSDIHISFNVVLSSTLKDSGDC